VDEMWEWICNGTSKRPRTKMRVVLDGKMWMCVRKKSERDWSEEENK